MTSARRDEAPVALYYDVDPPEFRCARCGARQPLALPADVRMVAAFARAFTAAHRRCRA